MHELFAVQKLIEEANKQGKVKEITIELGELAPVHDHDLIRTFKQLTKWKVKVTETKAKVKCECGYEGEPKIIERTHEAVLYTCPKCGKKPKVLEGDEIILTEVVVE
jgi:Zn finger protein HypA/HybF involved in hydrogenase expression